jgi:hypothetical protein
MALKKDKQKVIGETLSDERIVSLLADLRATGCNDHELVLRGYRALRAHDFKRFINLMKVEGLKTDMARPDGRTPAEIIAEQAYSTEYLEALK